MLTFGEINEIEIIFLAIDTGLLCEEICDELICSIFRINKEAHAYLIWLLGRWVMLRKDKSHLPTIAKHRISINELIDR
jgi:hypothetical protein